MFKNMIFYRTGNGWPDSFATFCEALESKSFVPCSGLDMLKTGWVPPDGQGEIAYESGQDRLVALRIEKKLVPPSMVKRISGDRVRELEQATGKRVGRKQRNEIKEAVLAELLPRALSDIKDVHVWFDLSSGWIGVDTSSETVADHVAQAIEKSFESAEFSLVRTQIAPSQAMKEWLLGEAPQDFSVDMECELESVDKAKVKYSRHSLDREDIREHLLREGKLPKALAMTWRGRLSFVLNSKAQIRKLGFHDIVVEEVSEAMGESEDALAADLLLLTGEMRSFLPAVVDALGGADLVEV